MALCGNDLLPLMGEIGLKPALMAALRPELPLMRQGLDSADFPAFVALVEERFDITMDDEETLRLRSLDDFAAYINARKG